MPAVESNAGKAAQEVAVKDVPESSNRRKPRATFEDEEFPRVFAAAVSGFTVVRPALLEVLETKIMNLRQSRQDEFASVASAQRRLEEEKDRLKFVERKLGEKIDSHERATEEYERARAVLIAARVDETNVTTADQKIAKRTSTTICENLVSTLAANVEANRCRRSGWDFKVKRQTVVVGKMEAELAAARAKYRSTCASIDAQLVSLSAGVDLIARLE